MTADMEGRPENERQEADPAVRIAMFIHRWEPAVSVALNLATLVITLLSSNGPTHMS
ncbi:hypothetical protein [Streptomyces triticiradicis]|uniref:hypothetical protein n=1 Tax=Streptomyces triticiradicis TaxID=2651189 RepID=UPI001788D74A|nr:hypothetical protein [Streptomyces triticiradicis]